MRWMGMPMAMWAVFARSFQTQLTEVLGYDAVTAKQITKTAKPKYKEIIAKLPEFEKGDRFQLNTPMMPARVQPNICTTTTSSTPPARSFGSR